MAKTTVDIDAKLLADAKAATGAKTTREVVNEGLWVLARRQRLSEIAALQGTGFTRLTQEELRKMREDE